jgi:hypothetical protein
MTTYVLEELELESHEGVLPERTKKTKAIGVRISDAEIVRQFNGLMGIEYAHQHLEEGRWAPCLYCRELSSGPVKGLALSVEEIATGCPMFGKYKEPALSH